MAGRYALSQLDLLFVAHALANLFPAVISNPFIRRNPGNARHVNTSPLNRAGTQTYPYGSKSRSPPRVIFHLWVSAVPLPTTITPAPTDGPGTAPQWEKRRPPFATVLPTHSFSVTTYAEAWRYDGIVED